MKNSHEFSDKWIGCPYFDHIKTECGHPQNKSCDCEEAECPTEPKMRMLAVRQHYANYIVNGHKTVEVKPTDTPYRGTVALYAGGHKPTRAEHYSAVCLLQSIEESGLISHKKYTDLLQLIGCGPYGRVIGTVEIVSTEKVPFTYEGVQRHDSLMTKHFASRGHVFRKTGKPVYHWHLKNPVIFENPVKLDSYPSGGPWAKVPKCLLPEIK